MNSDAAAARSAAYENAVAALRKINPKAVPVAKIEDAFSIPRVAEQARQAVAPPSRAASPEAMLHSRISNMENAVSVLVAEAKRKGIKAQLPPANGDGDLGARLQMLNAMHDKLEKDINYFNNTTREQRAIDSLGFRVQRIEKRIDAIATAMAMLNELLPHLISRKK